MTAASAAAVPLADAVPEWDDTDWDVSEAVLPEGPWPDESACARWAMVERCLARPHRPGSRIWKEVDLTGEADDFVVALCARSDAMARAAARAAALWGRVGAWLRADSPWARLRFVLEERGVPLLPDHEPLRPAECWLEVCPSHGPPAVRRRIVSRPEVLLTCP